MLIPRAGPAGSTCCQARSGGRRRPSPRRPLPPAPLGKKMPLMDKSSPLLPSSACRPSPAAGHAVLHCTNSPPSGSANRSFTHRRTSSSSSAAQPIPAGRFPQRWLLMRPPAVTERSKRGRADEETGAGSSCSEGVRSRCQFSPPSFGAEAAESCPARPEG